jgi:cytidylate kinase
MSIITISRGSHSMGVRVAELVSDRLGYECIAREILLEASEQFNIPEAKLLRAMHDSPSVLERVIYGNKEKYVAYVQAALLRHLQKDNAVYHGLAGQFFLHGVSHVLKVRILAETEDRIRIVMERDDVTREKAAAILKHDDAERLKWSQSLYGVDSQDPRLYDMVLRVHKLTVEDAADMICHAVDLEQFRTTPESQQAMDDRVLAAETKAALVGIHSDIKVWASGGAVRVLAKTHEGRVKALTLELEEAAGKVVGVQSVEIQVEPAMGTVWGL